MKPQDIVYLLICSFLLYKRNPRLFALFGLGFLVIALPLFYFQIFFTAERLTWYAASFFLVSILLHLYYAKNS